MSGLEWTLRKYPEGILGHDGTAYRTVKVDSVGRLIIVNEEMYKASDIETSADTKYYGFVHSDGSWYIMQEITTAGSFRFTKGNSGYSTGWTGRAGHSYGYYDVIF
jgi:hypothetical protein